MCGSSAKLSVGPVPSLDAYKTQLRGNAIKRQPAGNPFGQPLPKFQLKTFHRSIWNCTWLLGNPCTYTHAKNLAMSHPQCHRRLCRQKGHKTERSRTETRRNQDVSPSAIVGSAYGQVSAVYVFPSTARAHMNDMSHLRRAQELQTCRGAVELSVRVRVEIVRVEDLELDLSALPALLPDVP